MSIENGEIDLLHDIRVAAATLITLRDDCVGDGTTKGRMAAMELHAQRINAALQALRGRATVAGTRTRTCWYWLTIASE